MTLWKQKYKNIKTIARLETKVTGRNVILNNSVNTTVELSDGNKELEEVWCCMCDVLLLLYGQTQN